MQIQTELERYRSDALYFEARRQELLQQYPEHWIAVYDQNVVAAAPELPYLLDQLDRKGLPRGGVFIERLSSEEDLLILSAR